MGNQPYASRPPLQSKRRETEATEAGGRRGTGGKLAKRLVLRHPVTPTQVGLRQGDMQRKNSQHGLNKANKTPNDGDDCGGRRNSVGELRKSNKSWTE